MTDQELITQIRTCRLADLSDGMDAIGLVGKGTMDPRMQPIREGIWMAGFAYTIKYVPARIAVRECKNWDEYYTDLVAKSPWAGGFTDDTARDKVFVCDAEGIPAGVWGSENTLNAAKHGAAGIVIDGACRDVREMRLQKANAFCTVKTPNHIYGRLAQRSINVPITCAGVAVNPGDIVCGDDDGVLVIPRERAEEVLRFALRVHNKDQHDRAIHYREMKLAKDETLGDVEL